MLINETSKVTELTKKAIEYYIEQGLICPDVLPNGYREFSEADIECLNKISVLRKLGLSSADIKVVLADIGGDGLKRLSVQKELFAQREAAKRMILDKLSRSNDYAGVSADLKAIEQNATVTEKLLNAFPGYYGRFICLHFARFLNEPLITDEQRLAYQEIIDFLDNLPSLEFPEDLQDYLAEATKNINAIDINAMVEKNKQSIENPEDFLSENKEALEYYLAFMQSDEYKNSPAFRMKSLLMEFNNSSGYYEIFIPAMKKLSSSYAEYSKQIEIANERLYVMYPEARELDK